LAHLLYFLPVFLFSCLPVFLSSCLSVFLSSCLPASLSACLLASLPPVLLRVFVTTALLFIPISTFALPTHARTHARTQVHGTKKLADHFFAIRERGGQLEEVCCFTYTAVIVCLFRLFL
jgi:hypothetical protein